MVHFYLNCTKTTETTFECETGWWKFIDFVYIFPLTRMIISIIGIVLNSIASFIFIFSKNMNTKFLNLLKHYTINSLMINLNSLILSILFFTQQNIYISNNGRFYQSYHWVFYFTYFYTSIFIVLYTFDGILDIFMVYERILLMKPKFKFLKHISAHVISFSVFLFCCIINIPINIGKGVQKNTIEVNNVSLGMFKIYLKKFNYQTLFSISVLSTNAIRDILPLIIGIVLNVYLVIVTIRFHKNRTSITTDKAIIFKKTNINNTKLAFILGMISAYFHINNFCFYFGNSIRSAFHRWSN